MHECQVVKSWGVQEHDPKITTIVVILQVSH